MKKKFNFFSKNAHIRQKYTFFVFLTSFLKSGRNFGLEKYNTNNQKPTLIFSLICKNLGMVPWNLSYVKLQKARPQKGPQNWPQCKPRNRPRNAHYTTSKMGPPERPPNEPLPKKAHQWGRKRAPKKSLKWTPEEDPKWASEMAPKWASENAPNWAQRKMDSQ